MQTDLYLCIEYCLNWLDDAIDSSSEELAETLVTTSNCLTQFQNSPYWTSDVVKAMLDMVTILEKEIECGGYPEETVLLMDDCISTLRSHAEDASHFFD